MSGIDPKQGLLIALTGFALFYLVVLVRRVMQPPTAESGPSKPTLATLAIGFVTNFFDTLGIGSYATTTAMFRKWKLVPDERIPGTLNIGHIPGTVAQAFIFTTLVPVEAKTLILMILAAVLGSWLGSGVVASWPRRKIQIGMGTALLGFAVLMIATVLKLLPVGGELLALSGPKLAIGMAGNFALGALMTLGIGLYAPCMVLIYLLGMTPAAAFPIMMGSCAFLMPIASARFIKAERFNMPAVLGLAIGGLPAVFIAAPLVAKVASEYVNYMRMIVIFVILYAAIGLLLAAKRERAAGAAAK